MFISMDLDPDLNPQVMDLNPAKISDPYKSGSTTLVYLFLKNGPIQINFVQTLFAFGLILHSEEGTFGQRSFGPKAYSTCFVRR
jgi:hypothetical protein